MPRDDDLLFFHRWIFQNGWARSPTIRFAMGPDWIGLDGKGEWMDDWYRLLKISERCMASYCFCYWFRYSLRR